jgi:flagella basal body P-ring formation protein FlgA
VLRIYLLIVLSFLSSITFASSYNYPLGSVDKLITQELKNYLIKEQILDNLEDNNIKIEINYLKQKNQDLNSLAIKKFVIKSVNIKRHEFDGIIYLDDNTDVEINILGKYKTLISLPVLKVKLPKDHVISEMDLEEKFFNSEIISSAFITAKEDLIGMTLKKMLKADVAIKKEHITSQILVKKNDVISLEHSLGKVTLKVLVTALESGSVGDFINVKNAKTKQVMSAEIINDRTVKLKLN